jgi:hypothetical protein
MREAQLRESKLEDTDLAVLFGAVSIGIVACIAMVLLLA